VRRPPYWCRSAPGLNVVGVKQTVSPPVLHASPFVAGRWRDSGAQVTTQMNPAQRAEVVGRWSAADEVTVESAIETAAHGAEAWARVPALERGRVLIRAAETMEARCEELAELITREEGKLVAESRIEVLRSAETLRYHGSQAWLPMGEVFHGSSPDDVVRTERVPVGVVGVITPWNFPLNIPVWKIAPALVHGCPVVWKPASQAVLVGAQLTRILHDAGLPHHALQFVPGPGSRGEQIATDPRVAAVTFTGSEAVGTRLRVLIAQRGAALQAELGGHNPAVVFPDADLDATVGMLVTSMVSGTGQKCTAARRILVHESVREPLLRRLLPRLAKLSLGDGREPGVDVGPLVTAQAREEVTAAIRRAVAQGAEVLHGGPEQPAQAAHGEFVTPTLLATTDRQDLDISCEEVFGPVATVTTFRDEDRAFALANATRFGLSASVFTGSERRARRAVAEIRAGLININKSTTGSEPHLPFGGMKASSAPGPKEQGLTARDFFTETKAVYSTALH
jgi:acyl-CoA reductase-like NAD-dependent aldehyde dehydrogenase